MAYEIYSHDRNYYRIGARRQIAAISLSPTATFRINCAAGKKILNGSSAVVLFRDPDTLRIAIRSANDDDKDAYTVRREKNGDAGTFNAIFFARELGIYGKKMKFRPKLNEELGLWELEPIDPENY